MAREAIYRAWDLVREEYLSGGRVLIEVLIGPAPGSGQVYLDTTDYAYKERFILEQFTGLKDKNGKGIYEGDIVGFGDAIPQQVTYFDGKFGFGSDRSGHSPLVQDRASRLEVIGTILQSPKLLEM